MLFAMFWGACALGRQMELPDLSKCTWCSSGCVIKAGAVGTEFAAGAGITFRSVCGSGQVVGASQLKILPREAEQWPFSPLITSGM
ncbi:hypothetical protein C8T65DRAFT_650814 [Cerioporus squamosus]|nr:hypothetical protein C8T65DRAFT_650814 [Cerioporus squamosus]